MIDLEVFIEAVCRYYNVSAEKKNPGYWVWNFPIEGAFVNIRNNNAFVFINFNKANTDDRLHIRNSKDVFKHNNAGMMMVRDQLYVYPPKDIDIKAMWEVFKYVVARARSLEDNDDKRSVQEVNTTPNENEVDSEQSRKSVPIGASMKHKSWRSAVKTFLIQHVYPLFTPNKKER